MKGIKVIVIAALFTLAGCGNDKPASPPALIAGSAGPSAPAASASAAPSVAPSDSAVEFTVDGAGPYQLDAMLADLRQHLEGVTPGAGGCPDTTTARGTGVWKDVQLSFRKDGKLYLAVNKSPAIPTPSGAWLGTTLAQLKTIYAGLIGEELRSGAGYLVTTVSGRGILFELDAGRKVTSMIAGDAAYLATSFTSGAKYC